jgi:putative inorganic carbon (HCO3(-)) transporter
MPLLLLIPVPHLGLIGISGLVVYIGAILAFLLSAFGRPHVGIYFIVPLYTLASIRARAVVYPLGKSMVYVILLGVVLGLVFGKGYKLIPKTPLNKLLLAQAFLLYVSLWQGSFFLGAPLPLSLDDPRFEDWVNYLLMPVTFLLVTAAIREVKQIKVLLFLMGVSTALAARSVYAAVADRTLTSFSYDIRDGGTFGYAGANGAGAFFAWAIVMLVAFAGVTKNKLLRLGLLLLAGYSSYDLLLTFSRGAYLAALTGITLLALIKERKILILLIPFLFTWQMIVPGAVRDRISMTYDSSGNLDASAAHRVSLWEDAEQIIQGNLVIGTGFNTYRYMGRDATGLDDTHNYFIKVIAETGIFGLLLCLTVFGSIFRTGYQLHKRARDPWLRAIGTGLMPAIVALFIANMFGDRWQYLQITGFLWALLGCATRGLMLTETEEAKTVEEVDETGDLTPALAVRYGA